MSAEQPDIQGIVRAVLDARPGQRGLLLPVLHAVQSALGHIPAACVADIARELDLSRAEVHGVITFYHDFRTRPPGRTTIHICRAEACQATGARALEDHAMSRLGLAYGEVTPDGEFGLEPVYCLGNCACSPSVRFGDDIHARMDAGKFDRLLEEYGDGRRGD